MLCECGCGQDAPIAKRSRSDRGHVRGKPIRYLPGHGTGAKVRGEYVPNLREIRKRFDMSQRRFAELVGVSHSFIGRIERGERAGPETVMKLVRVVAALQRIERNRERLWVA